jgi:TonB family protein
MEKLMSRVLDSGWNLTVGLVFAAALALPADTFAQRRDAERDRESDEQDINRRSFNLRMLNIMAKQRRPRKSNPQLALAQLQDDFTYIQKINKQLGLAALGKADLDLSFVTKSAAEINKRAERLKDNLALPVEAESAEPIKQYTVENASQLKAPIVDLARLILDFTDNAFFQEAGVVETPEAHRARRDLEKIIWLSEEITNLSKNFGQAGTSAQSASAQSAKEQNPEKTALDALHRREVPEATLACTPDEARWWEEVRAASANARRGEAEKFVQLLKQGQDNKYHVPIADRGITTLRRVPPRYTDEARRAKISGGIAMVVEFLKDGTIGEIKIVKGLGAGLDEKAADAARQIVFLPAVKDAQFVSARLPMTMSFDLY